MKGSFLTRYQNPFQNVKNKNKKPVLKQYNVVVEREKSLTEETEDQKGEMTSLRPQSWVETFFMKYKSVSQFLN